MDQSKHAFPRPASQYPSGDIAWEQDGMSLREWYAGMALMGVMANPNYKDFTTEEDIAKSCWVQADKMLEMENK
jgi:hypothetical protein